MVCYVYIYDTLHYPLPRPGKEWIKQMVAGGALFPSLVCGSAFIVNLVAISYHASRAIPFLTMVTHPRHGNETLQLRKCRNPRTLQLRDVGPLE